MSNKYIVEFCKVDSLIHRFNPSIKLINLFLIIFVFFLTNDLILTLFPLTIISVLILLSNIPIMFYLRVTYTSIYLFMPLVLILAPFIALDIIGIIILKTLIIILNLMLIIHTTSTESIATGTMKIINAFNIFFINMNKLGIKICQFLKFIPIFYQTLYRILDSGASRGIDYRYSTIIGKSIAFFKAFQTVFILSCQKVKTLGHSMEQRLFLANTNRLKINFRNINFNDYFFLAIHLLLIVYYIARVR